MQENKISFPDILKEEFKDALQKSTTIKVVENASDAQADVHLKVNIYGLSQSHGFSKTLYPMINITAVIKKPDGSTVWKNTDYINPQNSENSTGYTMNEYLSKPENLREVWKNISAIVSRSILSDLKKQ